MVRSSRSLSTNRWRYINPAYYLKRPKRLAFLFIVFVCLSFLIWDRQTLVREHEVEVARLNGIVLKLQNLAPDNDSYAIPCSTCRHIDQATFIQATQSLLRKCGEELRVCLWC